MDIYFTKKKLEKVCSQEKEMQKQLGAEMAKKLKQRLMELKAATNLLEVSYLPPTRLHELTGNRRGQFTVDLKHPYRLLFIPVNDTIVRLKDGGIDRSKVTLIEIIEIIDFH